MSESDTKHKLHIEEAFLKGFKSIDNLHIKLNPGLNIIIGPNGSGKSNLLEFLSNAIYSIYRMSELTFKSAQLILKLTNGDKINYQIERVSSNKSQSSAIDDLFSEPFHQSLKVNNELAYDDQNEDGIADFKFHNNIIKSSGSIRSILGRIGQRFILQNYIRYNLSKNLSGIEDSLSVNIPLADYDFFFEYNTESGLINDILFDLEMELVKEYRKTTQDIESDHYEHPFLKIIKEIDAEYIIKRIKINKNTIDNLYQFTPIKNLRVNENINIFRDDKNLIIDNIKLDFFVNDHWLPWSQLSDGTKRLFFIVSEVARHTNGIFLIEEPELGVHPHQFDLIMKFLEEQSSTKQIIMSTHSPKALDILDKNNLHRIFITKYEKGKGTTISNLNQQQKEKATMYMEEVGFLSDYWLLSDLEA